MQRIESHLTYYQFNGFAGINHGVFTRKGGVSSGAFDSLNLGGTVGDDPEHVRQNHALIYDTLGLRFEQTVTVWQVHGVDTVMATAPAQGRRWLAQADAIMTDRAGLALVMRYADCTPIMAYDPARGAIGIAHAGWRGTVRGMAANLIHAMRDAYGSRPQDIRAAIGPSIGPDRYQVGEEVVSAVQDHYGTTDGLIKRDAHDGSAYLNLWEANTRDLLRAGVAESNIEVAGICTATHTDKFYSHRAEKGKTGRFGVVMCLDERPVRG